MSQQYGLGRGLASLIPPKKNTDAGTLSQPFASTIIHPAGMPFAVTEEKRSSDDKMKTMHTSAVIAPISSNDHPEEKNNQGRVMEIPLHKIVPNPHQPRLQFDDVKLAELAESIKEHGILQPLVVTKSGADTYEIIAGERRFQASKKAGLKTVPVLVRDATEQEKLELAIIENIQRHDLNPIEEAKAFLRLQDEFGLGQEAVAKKMGKSRSVISNTMRLLHLPIEIQRAVSEGKISEGHAKALLSIENPEKQRAVFDLIIKEELTVRETEIKVRSVAVGSHIRSSIVLHPEIISRTEHLTEILGTKVKIAPSGKGGKIMIEYYSPEDLDGLLRRLEE
ncbi:MAG: hypothetical protein COZ27_00400 [Candidatus Moranbacteria bacterium CG_4_10_14_3_um_filter_41_65]|nr:MAG: hypothetical protein COZ27_00400 [Candidatus Moranbacteria bacterium CG_4_10_14_3_um_filter_41_65]PJC00006.1 MAG: hypothetical protein CO075_02900 [Candidatus Moranbacteria bacterium CG_4_9_14_0_8_um_filter_41_43]HCJ45542.1 hypothetical protein [Candidatus Moranbacteria bacterium]